MTISILERCKTVKELINKADKATDKAGQFKNSAGCHLKVVRAWHKDEYTGEMAWGSWVEKHCGLNVSRSNELIMIADGRKTEEESRTGKRESIQRTRDKELKPPPCGGGNNSQALVTTITPHPTDSDPYYAACNYDYENPDPGTATPAYTARCVQVAIR